MPDPAVQHVDCRLSRSGAEMAFPVDGRFLPTSFRVTAGCEIMGKMRDNLLNLHLVNIYQGLQFPVLREYSTWTMGVVLTSLITNNAAIVALQTLRAVNSSLQDTQQRVSSGFGVEKAADNAAYWSIATTMRSDVKAINAVSDSLGIGAAVIDTAYTASVHVKDILSEISAKLVTASEASVDRNKVGQEIEDLKNQYLSVVGSASFAGVNLLQHHDERDYDPSWNPANNPYVPVTSGYIRNGDGTVAITQIIVDLRDTVMHTTDFPASPISNSDQYTFGDPIMETGFLYQLFSPPAGAPRREIKIDSNTDTASIRDMIKTMGKLMEDTVKISSTLGSISKRIDLAQENIARDISTTQSGIGRLVDADMEEESSRLAAEQTQQQLAVQSLSIANTTPQKLLSLFQ